MHMKPFNSPGLIRIQVTKIFTKPDEEASEQQPIRPSFHHLRHGRPSPTRRGTIPPISELPERSERGLP